MNLKSNFDPKILGALPQSYVILEVLILTIDVDAGQLSWVNIDIPEKHWHWPQNFNIANVWFMLKIWHKIQNCPIVFSNDTRSSETHNEWVLALGQTKFLVATSFTLFGHRSDQKSLGFFTHCPDRSSDLGSNTFFPLLCFSDKCQHAITWMGNLGKTFRRLEM